MKQLDDLNAALHQIVKAGSIEPQREAFYSLSKQLVADPADVPAPAKNKAGLLPDGIQ